MRAAQLFAFAILTLCLTQAAHAQLPGSGAHVLAFESGSPSPTSGGVNVAVIQKAAEGYTCIQLVIRLVDNATGETLVTHIVANPPSSVIKSFSGLGPNRVVEVIVSAGFAKEDIVEAKRISAVATTQ
jgi:hypothetical protein